MTQGFIDKITSQIERDEGGEKEVAEVVEMNVGMAIEEEAAVEENEEK